MTFDLILLTVLLSFLIIRFTFILRSNYRLQLFEPPSKARYPLDCDEGDAMTHLLLIDLIRKNGNKIPKDTPQFLFSSGFDYPALFHKILSYFPKTKIENSEWRISPFIDAFHSLCVFLASVCLLLIGFEELSILLISILTAISWTILPVTGNPARRTIISERPFGMVLGHAYLFFVVMYLGTDNNVFFAFAIICFLLLAASSKFSFQAIILISTIFTIISLEIEPLIIVVVSLLVSIVLTGGYVFRVMKGTIRHSIFYRNFLVKHHDYTTSFSHREIIEAGKLFSKGKLSMAKEAIEDHPVYKIWVLFPWLVPFILDAVISENHSNEVRTYLQDWVWGGLIVTLLTTTDWFKFLGEAERYLEYVALPMIFLCLTSSSEIVQLLIIFPIMVSIYCLTKSYNRQSVFSSASNETIDLHQWLEKQPASIILSLPGRLSFPLAYNTEHKFIWSFINVAEGDVQEEWKGLFAGDVKYPYFEPAVLKKAYQKYKANFLILDKKGLNFLADKQDIQHEIDDSSVIYNNERYVVMDAEKYANNAKF